MSKTDYFRQPNANPSLKDEVIFEIKSFIFFEIFYKYKKIQGTHKLLNLGCGQNAKDGFDNVDAPRFRSRKSGILPVDLRKKLPFDDESYEGVFIEHTLEHFSPNDGLALLSEIFRILKPQGKIRIIVPDLDMYLGHILKPAREFSHLKSSAETIFSLTQDWGHKNVFNLEILKLVLIDVGFTKVTKTTFMNGTPDLLIDEPLRKWESLYLEAQK